MQEFESVFDYSNKSTYIKRISRQFPLNTSVTSWSQYRFKTERSYVPFIVLLVRRGLRVISPKKCRLWSNSIWYYINFTVVCWWYGNPRFITTRSTKQFKLTIWILSEKGLTVNTDQTKVLIFRKRGRVDNRLVFTYNDNQLDIVPWIISIILVWFLIIRVHFY